MVFKKKELKPPLQPLKAMRPKLTADVTANISIEDKIRLEDRAKELCMPVGRLVAVAIKNEMASINNFKLDFEIPFDPPYVEDAYMDEALKIYAFFDSKFVVGVAPDFAIMFHDNMGIPDRARYLLGVRELIRKGYLEEYAPSKTMFNGYPRGFKFLRIPGDCTRAPVSNVGGGVL